jgi:hypothetical protein
MAGRLCCIQATVVPNQTKEDSFLEVPSLYLPKQAMEKPSDPSFSQVSVEMGNRLVRRLDEGNDILEPPPFAPDPPLDIEGPAGACPPTVLGYTLAPPIGSNPVRGVAAYVTAGKGEPRIAAIYELGSYLRIFDGTSGAVLQTIERDFSHVTESVEAFALPSGQAVIAVGYVSSTVRLYDGTTFRLIRELPANDGIFHQWVCPDAATDGGPLLLGTGVHSNYLEGWDPRTGEWEWAEHPCRHTHARIDAEVTLRGWPAESLLLWPSETMSNILGEGPVADTPRANSGSQARR